MTESSQGLFGDIRLARSPEEQYRLVRFQLFNWGTFQNYHDITVPRKGYLFLGASGSGKTTLLDLISTMLIPYASVEYNTSARDARKNDRTLLSYVRGAWAAKTEEESGEIATDFLRKGTTWSAAALTFRQGGSGPPGLRGSRVLTLLQLFWVYGSANTRVNRHYMIAERDIDLDSISFGKQKLDIRAFKKEFRDDLHFRDFSPYSERFRSIAGIESEKSLKLLQKTQSMKNIENLEVFLKDFMLDKPRTFEIRDHMVKDFEWLNESYNLVVNDREMIALLNRGRVHYNGHKSFLRSMEDLETLKSALGPYLSREHRELLKRDIAETETRLVTLEAEEKAAEAGHQKEEESLDQLKQLQYEKGGDAIRKLDDEIRHLKTEYKAKERALDRAKELAASLGLSFSQTPESFGRLTERVRGILEAAEKERAESERERSELTGRKGRLEDELSEARRQLAVLETRRTNIPAENLDMRDRAARALRLEEGSLPFAGELIGIQPGERRWQGAMERALRGFALSVICEDSKAAELAEYINSQHLNGRLSYLRKSDNAFDALPPVTPAHLSQKIEVKEGPHRDWIARELRRAFDYVCCESLQDFHRHERSITLSGAVREGRTLHVKDDSRPLADITRWVTGFDNVEKLAFYRSRAQELGNELDSISLALDGHDKKRARREARVSDCQKLSEYGFEDVHAAQVGDKIDAALAQKRELEDDPELRNLGERLEKQKKLKEAAFNRLTSAKSQLSGARDQHARLCAALKEEEARAADAVIPYEAAEKLKAIIARQFGELTRGSILRVRSQLYEGFAKDIGDLRARADEEKTATERVFLDFKSRFPKEAADHGTGIGAAPEFMAKLEWLEGNGLPGHEKNFFDLLNRQSSEFASQLSQLLTSEAREIQERLDEVNRCLSDVPFSVVDRRPTYIRIKSREKFGPELADFRRRLREVAEHSLDESDTLKERRFEVLKKLVADLSSQERDMVLWQESVIDVRSQLEFIGVELDAEGNEVESYRSGSGKSGGQRQKLAATCLAAALRYQLGGRSLGSPAYGTVVFDEAFAKTDSEHSKLAMDIFDRLGFQMIMATPNKGVKAAEPYIGGAGFVYIQDRRISNISPILYDEARRALDWEGSAAALEAAKAEKAGKGGGGADPDQADS